MVRSIRLLPAAIVAAIGAATVPAPSAGAGPAPAAPAVAAPAPAAPAPITGLDGANRFRDLTAGLTTADGRALRTGVVYRSNDLSRLTDAGRAQLADHGVSLAVDMRAITERTERPDVRLPAGTDYLLADMAGLEHGIGFAEALPVTIGRGLAGAGATGSASGSAAVDIGDVGQFLVYPLMVSFDGSRGGLASALRAVAANDTGATTLFCIGGKDRTGWVSAVLLTILGVPRDQIEADFLAFHTDRGEIDPVQLTWLRSSFETVDAIYGDFDTFVRDGLGLDTATVTALRTKLIA